ncbi:unnamed protein product [Linum trigynum]|uniref:Uncharacterized protein n=1 Tax=Linum trigynum TaxID=586398 RepID=A0AAV2EBT5_9ROSI
MRNNDTLGRFKCFFISRRLYSTTRGASKLELVMMTLMANSVESCYIPQPKTKSQELAMDEFIHDGERALLQCDLRTHHLV